MATISETARRIAEAVSQDRLWRRHEDLARFGATAKGGVNRQALSSEEAEARRYLLAVAAERGFDASTDAAGNFFLRLDGTDPALPPVLTGSHIDSQPTGGRFDGIFGVLAGLEALEAMRDAGWTPPRAVELVGWMNEEGSRFAPGMMGSEAFTGVRALDEILPIADHEGITVAEALKAVNAALPAQPEQPFGRPLTAYVEAHIEQGPVLEQRGVEIGRVTGIQGKQTWRVTVTGEAAHAGTTPMAERRDALIAALAMVQAMHRLCAEADPLVMFTVGRFEVAPNAPSVVPSRVIFSIDLRHPDTDLMRRLGGRFTGLCRDATGVCDVLLEPLVDTPSMTFDTAVGRVITAAAGALGHSVMDMPSAAGHDARHLAGHTPSGMIFIPCRGGVSHHESEWSEPEHLSAGARVLAAVLTDLAAA
jgi:beta-ureidopropionase / N-carbamoyl-L-amino-acid hydrolase